MTNRRVLIVGGREGGLGHTIASLMNEEEQPGRSSLGGAPVVLADHPDVQGLAEVPLDVTDRKSCVRALEAVRPTDVICCAGINLPDGEPGHFIRNFSTQLQVNAWGPMQLLVETVDLWMRSMIPPETGFNFVGVSSNSAHIARSQSAGYCASKAAFSQALRSVARRFTGYATIWGYEPGWINGTPMSDEVSHRLRPGVHPHRIPGGNGVRKQELARLIVDDLRSASRSLNGCMIRVDGGEQ